MNVKTAEAAAAAQQVEADKLAAAIAKVSLDPNHGAKVAAMVAKTVKK